MELHGAALRHTFPQQHTFMVNQLILKRNLGIKKPPLIWKKPV
jgi:hypothetical protein